MNRLLSWLKGLSAAWVAVLILLTASGFVGASVMAYRTYDYIEHDNDFCMSCHLMAEPFELFGQSAHRGLGCKACHKPTFVGRTQMALTQIIENPEEISVHAEVPNEKCASCHVDGNPEEWVLIANSAGHRVHFESDDPELEGLQCVECHSSGVHEFAATDQTCAQAGCHEDVEVRLGRMGDFAIHCAACHGFNAVQPIGEVTETSLAPGGGECFTCHAMRVLVEMPPDEPHQQVCSTCHNPHDQETPQQAGETCATVGCHDLTSDLTPFHEGLPRGVIEDCMNCHVAHDFAVDGTLCLDCHQDVFDDEIIRIGSTVGTNRTTLAHPGAGRPVPEVRGFVGLGLSPASYLHTSPPLHTAAAQEVQEAPRRPLISTGEVVFRHANHRDVDCLSCHESQDSHGGLTLRSLDDCRSCHHTAPVANDCRQCHTAAVLDSQSLTASGWRMDFSVGDPAVRDVPFTHRDHTNEDCSTCHADEIRRPLDVASCNSCHQEHHAEPDEASCMTCHEEPAADAHTVEAHRSCAGSECHTDAPVTSAPRSRPGCLTCHRDQVDHEPRQECAECHALPGVGQGGS